MSVVDRMADALGPIRGWQLGKDEQGAAAAAAAVAERSAQPLPLDDAMPRASTPLLRAGARA